MVIDPQCPGIVACLLNAFDRGLIVVSDNNRVLCLDYCDWGEIELVSLSSPAQLMNFIHQLIRQLVGQQVNYPHPEV